MAAFQGAVDATFVAFGIPSGEVSIDYANALVFKEAKVLGINGRRMFETWYQMEELLLSGRLELDEIVTHQIPFADFAKGFGLMQSGEGIKIVMNVGE